ncbi:MAG TPA: hypothetical protein DCY94_02330 [Firmicutes bacterium]|nr:hypothetical protein [Bacillota bacterium]
MNTLLKCLEVFFARCIDVSIGSVRTILLVKGKNIISCILAFIEILIWFYVARDVLTGEDTSIFIILSYAGGYAFGTYVGGLINKYLVRGNLTAFVVTDLKNRKIVDDLKREHYGVTVMSIEDEKLTLLIEFKKKNLKKLKSIIRKVDKNAFLIVNESLHVENGYLI